MLWSNITKKTKENMAAAAPTLAENIASAYLPDFTRRAVGRVKSATDSKLSAAESAALSELVARNETIAIQAMHLSKENPFMGGLTPIEAKRMLDLRPDPARSNLFLIEVSPISEAGADQSFLFNLMAVGFEYSSITVTGEYRKVGGALHEAVTGVEAVELNITTLDDADGSIKAWFANQAALAVASDGTFGVPANYGMRIAITHAFTNEPPEEAYTDTGIYRAANMALTGERMEDGAQQVQLTFAQIDTFLEL